VSCRSIKEHLLAPSTSSRSATTPSRRSRKRSTKHRRRRALVLVVAVLAVVALVAVGWSIFGDRIQSAIEGDDYSGTGNGTEVSFQIQEGDTGTSIGDRLEQQNVVKTSKGFVATVLAQSTEPVFLPGVYTLQEHMSAKAALDALVNADNRHELTFVIPEGTYLRDIFPIMAEGTGIPVAEFQAAASDPQSYGLPAQATSLEGFVFPATYTFSPGTDARTILKATVDRMFEALQEHGAQPDQYWDIVRMASLVQREAGLRPDFPKVARVFYNRLAIGMKLESDATVTYGTGNSHRVSTTDAERADASNPYNTYVHEGMIPTPISSPGDIAIDAAIHPADGTWLYFVTWNLETGETAFSTTYEEHQANVQKWHDWMAAHPEYSY